MTGHRYNYPHVVPLPDPTSQSVVALTDGPPREKRDAQSRERDDPEQDRGRA